MSKIIVNWLLATSLPHANSIEKSKHQAATTVDTCFR